MTKTYSEHFNEIAQEHKKAQTDSEKLQVLDKINNLPLPSYHKEVLATVLFEQPSTIPLRLHLLKEREIVRLLDSLLRVENAATQLR